MRMQKRKQKKVEGTSTEIMLNDGVEVTGGTSEEHPELSTVNEESSHIVGEEHHSQCTHSDEEAGSVVLHVSSDMNEKEKDDEEANETAAAKETEEISKEDVEIGRLIEERRNTPKEEKQRRKEVSKCNKNVPETKKRMKRQQDIHRILEDFKGVKNIQGIKSAKKRELITKIKNEKREVITSRKVIATVVGEVYKKYDDSEQKKN